MNPAPSPLYRWLPATEAHALGLGEQVAELVQDQNRIRGHVTWTPDSWVDRLWNLSEATEVRRGRAAVLRAAIRAMRVGEEKHVPK